MPKKKQREKHIGVNKARRESFRVLAVTLLRTGLLGCYAVSTGEQILTA
jgi:hypothetical protein